MSFSLPSKFAVFFSLCLMLWNHFADLTTPLVQAATKGNTAEVTRLSDCGADINAVDKNGETALMRAADDFNEAAVSRLLACGADVNAVDKDGETALVKALRPKVPLFPERAVVSLLLDHGAKVNRKALDMAPFPELKAMLRRAWAAQGGQQLVDAARAGRLDEVRTLLDAGVDDLDNTALTAAVENGHEAVAALLRETWKATGNFLLAAAEAGRLDEVRESLDAGANVNATNAHGETALHLAAEKGHAAVVSLLLDRGADVNAPGGYETPLACAASGGHAAVVSLLLDRGAGVNASGRFGPPLARAASGGHADVVDLLLDRGAEVNQMFDVQLGDIVTGPHTALSLALERGHYAVALKLVARGAMKLLCLFLCLAIGAVLVARRLVARGAKKP